MNRCTRFFRWYSTPVLAICNVLLVIVTACYLHETALLRNVAYRAFHAEASPKVFLADITSTPSVDWKEKAWEVLAIFTVKNVGGSEATDLGVVCELTHGDTRVQGEFGPIPYLFPTESKQFRSEWLSVKLSEKDFELLQQVRGKAVPFKIKKDFIGQIALHLDLKYTDHEDKRQSRTYRFDYVFHSNTWVVATE